MSDAAADDQYRRFRAALIGAARAFVAWADVIAPAADAVDKGLEPLRAMLAEIRDAEEPPSCES